MTSPAESIDIEVEVNGRSVRRRVNVRMTAADFIRDALRLRGTHLGCEHGVCGACTILVDGTSVRSCILYAPQLAGRTVTTVEGLEETPGQLHPLQAAFMRHHALQCGFCTAGILLTAYELLSEERDLTEEVVREGLSGNLCRCTGYQGIIEAVLDADQEWQR